MVAYTVDHEYSNYPNQSIFGVTRDDYSFLFSRKASDSRSLYVWNNDGIIYCDHFSDLHIVQYHIKR